MRGHTAAEISTHDGPEKNNVDEFPHVYTPYTVDYGEYHQVGLH